MTDTPKCPQGCDSKTLEYVGDKAWLCSKCGHTWGRE
jgi:ribosomal protein L37AE/L43A